MRVRSDVPRASVPLLGALVTKAVVFGGKIRGTLS